MVSPEDKSNVDRGYAWVVLLAGMCLNCIVMTDLSIQGVFFVEYMEFFQVSKANISMIGSLLKGLAGLSGIFLGPMLATYQVKLIVIFGSILQASGKIIAYFAPHLVLYYFVLGLFPGIAISCTTMGLIVAIRQYFDRRRTLALGLQAIGISISGMTSPVLAEWLTQQFSWRGALLIFGGIQLNGVVCGALMRPLDTPTVKVTEEEEGTAGHSSGCIKKYFDITVLTDLKLILHYISYGLVVIGELPFMLLLPARAVGLGANKQEGALLYTASSLAGLISKPIFGIIGDRLKIYRTLATCLLTAATGIIFIASYWVEDYTSLVVVTTLFGFLRGAYMMYLIAVLNDLTDPAKFPRALGFSTFVVGVVCLFAAPLAGALVDMSRSFAVPFLVFGVLVCIGSLTMGLLFAKQRRDNLRGIQNNDLKP